MDCSLYQAVPMVVHWQRDEMLGIKNRWVEFSQRLQCPDLHPGKDHRVGDLF